MHADQHARVRRIAPLGVSDTMQPARADALHVVLTGPNSAGKAGNGGRRSGHWRFPGVDVDVFPATEAVHSQRSTRYAIDCKPLCAAVRLVRTAYVMRDGRHQKQSGRNSRLARFSPRPAICRQSRIAGSGPATQLTALTSSGAPVFALIS